MALTNHGTPRSPSVSPLRRPRKWWRDRRYERAFLEGFLHDRSLLLDAQREVIESGLISHLSDRADEFWQSVRGQTYRGTPYNTGRATGREEYTEGVRIYALIRKLRPTHIVETGVCNGFSTAFLLLGLHANEHGTLHSVDFPEVAGEQYEPGTFWEGKAGSVVPPGSESGWAVPEYLKPRWDLRLGKSRDVLPGLVDEVGVVDMSMHDAEPTYENMKFEYTTVAARLRRGGVIVGNNYTWDDALPEVAAELGAAIVPVSYKMGIVVKP